MLFNLFFTPGFFKVEIKDGHLFGSIIDIINRGSPLMILALGGNAMTGGKFSIPASIVGALVIQSITTTIYSIGVPPEITLVVKATAVIMFEGTLSSWWTKIVVATLLCLFILIQRVFILVKIKKVS